MDGKYVRGTNPRSKARRELKRDKIKEVAEEREGECLCPAFRDHNHDCKYHPRKLNPEAPPDYVAPGPPSLPTETEEKRLQLKMIAFLSARTLHATGCKTDQALMISLDDDLKHLPNYDEVMQTVVDMYKKGT